jgi:hypothetical protein
VNSGEQWFHDCRNLADVATGTRFQVCRMLQLAAVIVLNYIVHGSFQLPKIGTMAGECMLSLAAR